MEWLQLQDNKQLDKIMEASYNQPQMIFKHSTRCSISATALNRLERSWNSEEMKNLSPYYLDLLNHRDISNNIAEQFGITHESPQLLLIVDGKCVYHNSHSGITYNDLVKHLPVKS